MAEVRGEPALGLRERKKQRTRATLIDAAVELCERQGFERTTVDQIAAIADVSPRTFSRYFATKDAIALALIDEVLDKAAVELARQPPDISHFEALRRPMCDGQRHQVAPAGELSAERMMCIVRIIMSSPTLAPGRARVPGQRGRRRAGQADGRRPRRPQAQAGVRGVGIDHHDRAHRSGR